MSDFRTCRLLLTDDISNLKFSFDLTASKEGINKIAEKILGESITPDDVNDTFINICETISGRLKALS